MGFVLCDFLVIRVIVFTVFLYFLYCVLLFFYSCIFILIGFVCTSLATATLCQLNCSK